MPRSSLVTLALLAGCGFRPLDCEDPMCGSSSGVASESSNGGTAPVTSLSAGSASSGEATATTLASTTNEDSTGGESSSGGEEPAPLKAFPSAYGAAAESTGGRGGVLIIVNTPDPAVPLLHNDATATTSEHYVGGLYAALQHPDPAYIIFDRSMNITLGVGGTGSAFSFEGMPDVANKTIFGQSAPLGGVTITGGTFRLSGRSGGARNLIFRYLRSRPVLNRLGTVDAEDDSYTWAFLVYGGSDVIVDHCSFSFAHDKAVGAFIDELATTFGMYRHTYAHNLIGDSHTAAYVEINPDQPMDPEEFVDDISFLANLTVGMNRTPNLAYDGYGEIMNTVVYGNNSKSSTIYHDIRLNHIANTQIRPDEGTHSGFNRIFTYDSSAPSVYTAGNGRGGVVENARANNQPLWKDNDLYEEVVGPESFVDRPFDPGYAHPYQPLGVPTLYERLIIEGDVGAYQYLDDEGNVQVYRDSFDEGQLEVVRSGAEYVIRNVENWVLPELPSSVRPADYDQDVDGMADAWELRTFGSLDEDYNGDADGDGYTNIEAFMNQVDD